MKAWTNTWTNFRGFGQATTVEMPRLTLLIGRNNVGKTSTYAPLLLLRQTLEARDPSTALLTRGALLDVGSYRDLITMHETERPLVLRLGLEGNVSVKFPARGSSVGVVELGAIELTFGSDQSGDIRLNSSRVIDSTGKSIIYRSRSADDQNFNVVSRLLPPAREVGLRSKDLAAMRKAMRAEQPTGFQFTGVGAITFPADLSPTQTRWEKLRPWFMGAYSMMDVYSQINTELERTLRTISYLGPLRSLPQRTYRHSAEKPTDVGREGQFAPELLRRTASPEINSRVNSWLTKLGYGPLEFEAQGEEYFQVTMRMPGAGSLSLNVAHCGVGLSQLLPILVQGLTAPDGGTFIAQQPEIHLNPAQQCLITDFLIETAVGGKRVVIESHSEHILLRLRRRIAEGSITSEDVAIYYCDYANGSSQLERIPIGTGGEITRASWPNGFFDEQMEDSFALARAQSNRTQVER